MKKKFVNKIRFLFIKILPLLLIIAVWFIFSAPYFVKGRIPFPGDYLVNNFAPWSAYKEFWGPVKNGAVSDVITQIVPWKKLTIDILKTGNIPFWNPYSFSGTPHLANYQTAVFSPFNLVFFLLPFADAWSLMVLLQPLLAGIFTYLFVRSLKISKTGSILSAVSFMFCGFMTVWLQYATLGYAILFLPLALYAVNQYFSHERRRLSWLVLLTLTIPLSFFSGHFQSSLYFILTVIIWVIYQGFNTGKKRRLVQLLFIVFLGITAGLPQLLPSFELFSQSVRSVSIGKIEAVNFPWLITLIAPDFFGSPVTRNLWFGHYVEWAIYSGVVTFLLALLTVRKIMSGENIRFFWLLLAVCLLLYLDTPIANLPVFLRLPVLSGSSLSRIGVLISFSLAVLAGFGLDQLTALLKQQVPHKSVRQWMILCLLVLVALWLPLLIKVIPLEAVFVTRRNLILPSLIIMGSSAAVSLAFLKNKRIINLIGAVMILLSVFDLLRFTGKWQSFTDKKYFFPETPVVNFLKDKKVGRVLGNFGAEAAVYFGLPSVEGYDPLFISFYGEFINSAIDGNPGQSGRSGAVFAKTGQYTSKYLDFLGIKYIVYRVSDKRYLWTFPFWQYPPERFKQVYNDGVYEVYENIRALPRVFLVGEYRLVNNNNQIFKVMTADDFDFSKEAVLEENPGFQPAKLTQSPAIISQYLPNTVKITTQNDQPALLVLTDGFYPGWRAFVSGREVKIFRANYAFRGVPVPAGRHDIIFRFM